MVRSLAVGEEDHFGYTIELSELGFNSILNEAGFYAVRRAPWI